MKPILKILIFGGIGTTIIGFSTGEWLSGSIYCFSIASLGQVIKYRKGKILNERNNNRRNIL